MQGGEAASCPGDWEPQHRAQRQPLQPADVSRERGCPESLAGPQLSDRSVQATGPGLAETLEAQSSPRAHRGPEDPRGTSVLLCLRLSPPSDQEAPDRPADARSASEGVFQGASLFPSLLVRWPRGHRPVPLLGALPAFRGSGNLFSESLIKVTSGPIFPGLGPPDPKGSHCVRVVSVGDATEGPIGQLPYLKRIPQRPQVQSLPLTSHTTLFPHKPWWRLRSQGGLEKDA